MRPLRRAEPDDEVLLVWYVLPRSPVPWRVVGSASARCPVLLEGGAEDSGLKLVLRQGPLVLRGYREDGSLDYAAIRDVGQGEASSGPSGAPRRTGGG